MKDKGDVAAAHIMTSHLRLLQNCYGHRGYGLPLADLISEGNLGMLHAVKFERKSFVWPPMPCGGSKRHSGYFAVLVACQGGTTAGQKKLFSICAGLKPDSSVMMVT